MKQYNSYKPSGVDWIGKIPENWDLIKLKYISNLYNGSSLNDNQKELFESSNMDDIPYVSTKDIDYNSQNIEYDNGLRIPKSNTSFKLGKKGSFLLCIEGGSSGKKMGFLEQDVYFVNKLCCFEPKTNSKYQYYFIQTPLFQTQFNSSSSGLIGGVSISLIRNFISIIPPLQEQEQIVKYLDEKTTIINKLISTKQRKVELLKEQRTSLINQVITKGLNPNMKMKDSGVEWIGEIPESWSVNKLKSLVDSNKKILSENTNPDYELKYIEIGDVNSLGEIKGMTEYLFKDSPSRCRRILIKGDIFISTVRTYLKSIGYVENEISDVICSTGFCVLTPKSDVLSKYLFYQVLTEFFIGEVISKSVGVSYPSITSTELINIKIIKPSIKEQQEIVEYLDTHTKEIDDLVSMEQKKIELLKEYRQSLISEVITGKLKVM